jgi:hypothetical protein
LAGHRIRAGKPKQAVLRSKRWRARLDAAVTAEAQFDIASDWARSSCHRLQDTCRAEQMLDEAARYLAELADRADREIVASTKAGGPARGSR